jgi:hypothetical protein
MNNGVEFVLCAHGGTLYECIVIKRAVTRGYYMYYWI